MIYKQREEINNVWIREVPGVLNYVVDRQDVGGLYQLKDMRCAGREGQARHLPSPLDFWKMKNKIENTEKRKYTKY
jgi:hypothetical protein